jgi:RimJ/RimL family protein N-acetyltransferase
MAPPRVRLVFADLATMEAAVQGGEVLGRVLGCRVEPGWAVFDGALSRLRDSLAADPGAARWGTRLFVHEDTLVGWGGFKGPPADGRVEIGYAIAPGRQGEGLATAAVAAMLREAYADPEVRAVLAHTLPERNASVRVLEKAGFARVGEAVERGRTVWEFRHPGPQAPGDP